MSKTNPFDKPGVGSERSRRTCPERRRRIKAVFFDMGGVMSPTTIHKVARFVEKSFDLEEGLLLTEQYYFVDEIYNQLETGKISEKKFWQEFFKRVKKPMPGSWSTIFPRALTNARVSVRPKMKKLVLHLKSKGIKTAVLSNVSEPYAKCHFRLGHYQFFDHLVLSHQVGIRKPDQRIFHHAFSMVKVIPEHSVFIDDLKENIKVAENLGMKGILYKNTNQVWEEIEEFLL